MSGRADAARRSQAEPKVHLLIERQAKSYIISLHLAVKPRVRVVLCSPRCKTLHDLTDTATDTSRVLRALEVCRATYARYIDLSVSILAAMLMELLQWAVHSVHELQAKMLWRAGISSNVIRAWVKFEY